ncbi:Transcriptional regulatory protein DevR (DosR) [bacterium HR36]|nr:Transcriptional regulatory protein DevR (DosR) [bacterium HR36]
MAETILIVDDEESVRRTLYEWLRDADSECELLQAHDAESALRIASTRSIDLAILDWNLGAGQNGLQLLEDLRVFSPEVVAILVTGYAHQATPLDALRMGVRDYLDKSRDLRRETLLAIVRRQLAQIRPAKRQREHLARVQQFRQAIEVVLPLVQTTAQLATLVPVSEALRALLRLAQAVFQTDQGVLIIRLPAPAPTPASRPGSNNACESGQSATVLPAAYTVLNLAGQPIHSASTDFADTLAAATLAMQEVCVLSDLRDAQTRFAVRLQSYEQGHRSLVAIPVLVENGQAAVFELLDTPWGESPWSDWHRAVMQSFREMAHFTLRQVFAERQLHAALCRALELAVQSTRDVTGFNSEGVPAVTPDWKALLTQPGLLPRESEALVTLAERLQALHRKYGAPVLRFCQELLHQLEQFLGQMLEPPAEP